MTNANPLWYKDAIIYEVHVRAFHDSVGDGFGDFRGLTQKLDYLQDLGVTAIWLLPFYPSPLRDDGYDIADYTSIHADYGTLDTFREFLDAAHSRGLRVITELVINHTSDQHPWFQRARRAPPGSSERNFYVWSDTPERYCSARIIFKDFESSNWAYDPVANAYYFHRFYRHQPDLNFDHPAVRDAILPLVDFWLEMGVDGLRLDAVPYLFEREGTSCENLPETHEFLKHLRKHVDARFPDRMLLAEANQWPEDAAAYFGNGDECHMAFHFPVMPRLFMGMHTEDRFPIVDILQQTPPIPNNCQWALFLRNHDELTLEMVTDEERDYMYRAYAIDRRARVNLGIRRRLAPLLGHSGRRIELMNGLLFSLPGTPVIYYGDEIGMGDNIYLGDRNGVRTPMQWSADRNAGFSRANPQKLYLPIIIDPEYHYEAINVEAQQANPSSLLWWNKRLIALRKRHRAFSRGDIRFLDPPNRKILAFVRSLDDERILVVANLSRYVQYVELDLSEFAGVVPLELFGSTLFPRITKSPYLLTLGPHGFYWFSLCPRHAAELCGQTPRPAGEVPVLAAVANWEQLFGQAQLSTLRDVLHTYFDRLMLDADDQRVVRDVRIRDVFRLGHSGDAARVVLVDVEFNQGGPETVVLPLAFASDAQPLPWEAGLQPPLLAKIAGGVGGGGGVVFAATVEPKLLRATFSAVARQESARGLLGGELVTWSVPALREGLEETPAPISLVVSRTEQKNQSVTFGGRWIMKVFRRAEEGSHPEVEMGKLLTAHEETTLSARLMGYVEYRRRHSESMALAVVHEFVRHESDALQYTLDVVSNYFERTSAATCSPPSLPPDYPLIPDLVEPVEAAELIGDYLERAAQIGRGLAELHGVLASHVDQVDFAPEPFTMQYQRSLYQSIRAQLMDMLDRIERAQEGLPDDLRCLTQVLVGEQPKLADRLRCLLARDFRAMRIRCHGDCHLGQLLDTGKSFVFVDFEGEPTRSVDERRVKRSPLRDVVGLLRSFDYATHAVVLGLGTGRGHPQGVIRPSDRAAAAPWAVFFRQCVCRRFLQAYLSSPGIHKLLPSDPLNLKCLLDLFIQERLVHETTHELRYRVDWLRIPLLGLIELVGCETELAPSSSTRTLGQ
jgi:maltose alpha-D-glucosyltransferase/alpha-amylase